MVRSASVLLAFLSATPAWGQEGRGEKVYYVGHGEKYANMVFESETSLETIVGTTNKVAGRIVVDGDKAEGAVELRIPVESLNTGIPLRNEHLRSPQWMDAKKFPEITFRSKKAWAAKLVGSYHVSGDFTIHGVTKEINVMVESRPLPEAVTRKAFFPPGEWVRFRARFEVRLSDFGVKIPTAIASLVSDTWKVKMVLFAGTEKPKEKKDSR